MWQEKGGAWPRTPAARRTRCAIHIANLSEPPDLTWNLHNIILKEFACSRSLGKRDVCIIDRGAYISAAGMRESAEGLAMLAKIMQLQATNCSLLIR